MPACAGMTKVVAETLAGRRSSAPTGQSCAHPCSSFPRKREPSSGCFAAARAWMPACAGMTKVVAETLAGRRSSAPTGQSCAHPCPSFPRKREPSSGCFAAARAWMPACAGMTRLVATSVAVSQGLLTIPAPPMLVVPAKAGTQLCYCGVAKTIDTRILNNAHSFAYALALPSGVMR
jgi:hypothetical protein